MSHHLGRYELLTHLASGGMAEIWLARQHGVGGFEKLVVIKKILPHLARSMEFVQMFLDEGRVASSLSHPHVVQMFDLGRDGRDYFLAMELVQGETLRDVLARAREKGQPGLPLDLLARIAADVCGALYYAHTQTDPLGRPLGIVHRDIGPANLILSYQGQVKIIDFGIAKAANKIQATRAGFVKGNLGYLAPEQAKSRPIDHRVDIFALGVVLWELATGHRLYDQDSDLAVAVAICEEPAPPPSDLRRDLPLDLEAIILKALEKDPDQRFADCHEMQMELERFLHARGAPVTQMNLGRYLRGLMPDRLEAWQRVMAGHPEDLAKEEVGSMSGVFLGTDLAVSDAEPTVVVSALQQGLATAEHAVPIGEQSTHPSLDMEAASERDETVRTNALPPGGDAEVPSGGDPRADEAPTAKVPVPADLEDEGEAIIAGQDAGAPADGFEPDLFGDDDEEDAPPPAIPLPVLIGGRAMPAAAPHGAPDERLVAEIIQTDGQVVLDSAVLRAGQGYRGRGTGLGRGRLARMGLSACTLRVPPGAQGEVFRGLGGEGEPISGPASVSLRENDRAEVRGGGIVWRARVYRPPAVPKGTRSPFATRLWATCLGVAVGVHVLVFLAFLLGDVVLGLRLPVADPVVAERFAEFDAAKEAEKPKPKKKPKKKPPVVRVQPKPADPTEAAPQIPERLRKRIQRRVSRHTSGGGGGAKSILNALTSPVQGEGTTLKEVVSNIDAVKSPGGGGAMRVAGTLAALPEGSGVNVGRGGSVDVGTLGGTEAVGDGTGKLKGRGKSRGKVRGKVSSVRALTKVRGSMSRGDVIAVINKHIGQINGCYERALNRNPGLSGKIEFEWTVRPNGRVATARERSSTMGNAQVSQCIIRVIRKMRFPKPKGGSVTIVYPFMFRSVPS